MTSTYVWVRLRQLARLLVSCLDLYLQFRSVKPKQRLSRKLKEGLILPSGLSIEGKLKLFTALAFNGFG